MSFSEASTSESAVSKISSVFTLPSFSAAPKKSSKNSPSSIAKWSDAMCMSVEERFSCLDNRCVVEDDDTLANETLESLTYDEQQSIISVVKFKKPKSKAKKEPKPVAKPDLTAAAALAAHKKEVSENIKSYNFLASYHSSKQNSTKPEESSKTTKDLTQGNHRGWGAGTPQKHAVNRKKFRANMMIRNKNKTASAAPLSSDDDTFDRTDDDHTYDSHTCSEDSETCGDTATYDGTLESSLFPEDQFPEDQTAYTDGSSYTSYGEHVRNNERDRLSRNDSLQSSERRKNSPEESVVLERELPSFGSKVDAMASANERHRSFASQISRSSIDSGSRYATPSYAIAETLSQKPKAAAKKVPPPPPPLPPPVEMVLKSTSKSTFHYGDGETVATATTSSSSDSYGASLSSGLSSESMQSKKIALGKSRARAKNRVGMTPEMATTKPKVFPYLINHSLFQQNIDNKKKKNSRPLSSSAAEF